MIVVKLDIKLFQPFALVLKLKFLNLIAHNCSNTSKVHLTSALINWSRADDLLFFFKLVNPNFVCAFFAWGVTQTTDNYWLFNVLIPYLLKLNLTQYCLWHNTVCSKDKFPFSWFATTCTCTCWFNSRMKRNGMLHNRIYFSVLRFFLSQF